MKKNYTDALIDSLIESETEPKTYLEKMYNWWCSVNKEKLYGKEAWDLIFDWFTTHSNWSFEEFRNNTNINELANYKSTETDWKEIFTIICYICKSAYNDENISLSTVAWEKGMEVAKRLDDLNVAKQDRDDFIKKLNEYRSLLDSFAAIDNKIHIILKGVKPFVESNTMYSTFNLSKLRSFAKRYNVGVIELENNSYIISSIRSALTYDSRCEKISVTHLSMAVAMMYLTFLATLNIYSSYEGILKNAYNCFTPDDPQPHFTQEAPKDWPDGFTGNIKINDEPHYYYLKFSVWWYNGIIPSGRSLLSYFSKDSTAGTLGKPIEFSDLTCEIHAGPDYSEGSGSYVDEYEDSIKGTYSINLFKHFISNLLEDIKLHEDK